MRSTPWLDRAEIERVLVLFGLYTDQAFLHYQRCNTLSEIGSDALILGEVVLMPQPSASAKI